jgi:hypothetical protein
MLAESGVLEITLGVRSQLTYNCLHRVTAWLRCWRDLSA